MRQTNKQVGNEWKKNSDPVVKQTEQNKTNKQYADWFIEISHLLARGEILFLNP